MVRNYIFFHMMGNQGYLKTLPYYVQKYLILLKVLILSPLLYFSPKPAGGRIELVIGANVAMILAIIPQIFLFVWFILVILTWIFQSLYIWRHNYPPFRIGTWLGLGAVSGLFVGDLFAHFVL